VRDAVIREVKEETSLDFFSKEKLGFYESAVNGRRYIAFVHLGEWSGAIRLQPEEISEHKFFTFKENQSFDCGVCVSRSD
jgi:ADP-ribose pyrophosphatase YjhB (NUDIX family)